MKMLENDVYREMTPEEIADFEAQQEQIPPPAPDPYQEQIDELWLAMAEAALGGDSV